MIADVMDQGAAGPSRRTTVRALLAAPVTLALAGCDVRLEKDAPDLPVLTTQGPLPDQALLLETLRSVQGLLRLAERTPESADAWVGPVRTAHRAQVTRLVEVMAGLGIDVPSAAGSSSPSPAPVGTPTSGSPTSSASSTTSATASSGAPSSTTSSAATMELAAAEGDFPKGATEQDAWRSEANNRPMLVSLCAARRAAQRTLGGDAYPRHGTPPTGDAARAMARAIRPAVHGFEQIAAKTPTDERTLVTDTLHWLEGARNDLGPVVDETERTSYALPVRVTDADSARRLARHLLAEVLTAVASQVGPVGNQTSAAQHWTLRVWSLTAADHSRWGAPLAAFPGMTS